MHVYIHKRKYIYKYAHVHWSFWQNHSNKSCNLVEFRSRSVCCQRLAGNIRLDFHWFSSFPGQRFPNSFDHGPFQVRSVRTTNEAFPQVWLPKIPKMAAHFVSRGDGWKMMKITLKSQSAEILWHQHLSGSLDRDVVVIKPPHPSLELVAGLKPCHPCHPAGVMTLSSIIIVYLFPPGLARDCHQKFLQGW